MKMKNKKSKMKKRAVFLDRDGTINKDPGYINKADNLRILPGVYRALKKLKKSDFYMIITSNQSGIARGLIKMEELERVNEELIKRLRKKNIVVDKIYFCPHLASGIIHPWNRKCSCRKPAAGMLEKAARDFNLDLKKSFVVGDKLTDILAGKKCNCKTILVLTGDGKKEKRNITGKTKPDFIARNLNEAVNWIINYGKKS